MFCKVYDIQYRSFDESVDCSTDTGGQLVGVARAEGALITASRDGALSYWTHPEPVQLDALGAEVETRGKLRGGEMEEDRKEKHRSVPNLSRTAASQLACQGRAADRAGTDKDAPVPRPAHPGGRGGQGGGAAGALCTDTAQLYWIVS